MAELPSFQDLYDEFEAEVTGDPDTQLFDFSAGSALDAFAAVAAAGGRGIMRWVLRRVASAFVSTAEGAELDAIIADRIGDAITRRTDESDESLRQRYFDWVQTLGRGTFDAWELLLREYVEEIDPLTFEISEDLEAGTTTLHITAASGFTFDQAQTALQAQMPAWRILGLGVNIVEN